MYYPIDNAQQMRYTLDSSIIFVELNMGYFGVPYFFMEHLEKNDVGILLLFVF